MADYGIPKSGVAYIFYGCLVSQADTKLFKSAPTLAAGDFKVSIDGGAFANLATLPTNTPGTYAVKFSLSAAEMTGDNILVVASDAAGAEWCDQCWNIQTSPRGIADLAYPATSGRSMVVDANGLVDANTVKVGPTGSGTAQTAGDIPARLPAALVSGRMDASVGAMAANTLTAAATAADFGAEVATAVWTDTTAGDFTVASSIGKSLYTTGNAPGAASGLALVGSNMGTVTSVTGAVGSVTGNVGGNVTGSVGSVTGAVGSVTGNVGGSVASVTAGVTVTTNNDKTGYALTAAEENAIADALLARNVSGGSSAGRTVKQALHLLRNKSSIGAGTLTVYDTDDTTSSWTAAVTTTAGNPISAVDPA